MPLGANRSIVLIRHTYRSATSPRLRFLPQGPRRNGGAALAQCCLCRVKGESLMRRLTYRRLKPAAAHGGRETCMPARLLRT
jgi:hypothetical protein